MRRGVLTVLFCAGFVAALVAAALPCALEYTFRAYRGADIWRPLAKYENALGGRLAAKERPETGKAFAGMGRAGEGALRPVREAYRAGRYASARLALDGIDVQALPPEERGEALLLDAKLDMRLAEPSPEPDAVFVREGASLTLGQEKLLESAREKLAAYLDSPVAGPWRDEAVGWLARVNALSGNFAAAAKFYLDELARPDSIYPRQSLVNSLRLLYPYNGGDNRLDEHVEEFLDTPVHALFAVSILTNPDAGNTTGQGSMQSAVRALIPKLHARRALFTSGEDSEALALCLMRAALYVGDVPAALEFSRMVPELAASGENPEYAWMAAICRVLGGAPGEAVLPLRRILESKRATHAMRLAAAMGLMNVMERVGDPAGLLFAAFVFDASEQSQRPTWDPPHDEASETAAAGLDNGRNSRRPIIPEGFSFRWPHEGWLLDLPYMLDVSLAEADLEASLARFGRDEGSHGVTRDDALRFSRTVNYALAARLARQERYADSAARYELAGEEKRATRMRQLASLHAKAQSGALKGRPLLLARFHYADFLSRHPNGVFYNDTLWGGYQSYALLCLYRPEDCDQQRSLSEAGLKRVGAYERVFRDAQEERWRAALLFTDIAAKAGPDWLGKTAALRAIDCLARIHPRFGRQEEIAGRIAALKAWRAGKAASVAWQPPKKAG